MNGYRRSMRASGPGVSFFAFQDVITAVIGIIVIITLVLALGTHALIPTILPAAADLARHQELERLLEKITELKRSLHEQPTRESESVLRSTILALETKRQALAERSVAGGSEDIHVDAVAAQISTMAESAATSLAAARAENQKNQEKLERLQSEMLALESNVLAAEQKLIAEQTGNKLRLIPDRSATTKEPIIITVARNEIVIQSFDSKEKSEITGRASRIADLSETFESFSPLDHYMVFFFKPSAFSDFADVLEVARKQRFDVGYDMVEEDVQLEFGSP